MIQPPSARLLKLRIRNLPLAAKLVVGLSLVLACLMYGYIFHYFAIRNHTSEDAYLEQSKCPMCFGKSICEDLLNGKAQLQGFSKLQFLNALANIKNVNYGEYRGYPVVFKKLAHDSELIDFDRKYVEAKDLTFLTLSKYVSVKELTGLSDMSKCPTPRLIDKILVRYKEMADAVDLSYPEKVQLATTLLINPEPIIFQTFPDSEGWPFPKYYGACGRFVVVENVGKSLSEFYNAPWAERANYALQIFRIAEQLTNNNVQFSLYFTDVGYDNFAVDSDGRVKIIDAENIIVVDKWQIKQDKKQDWDEPFFSDFDVCKGPYGDCLTIHDSALCTRFVSDFNYYAVCRNLLSSYASDIGKPGGLLHDTPEEINKNYDIDNLLNKCAKPDKSSDRLDIAEKLPSILQTIKKEFY